MTIKKIEIKGSEVKIILEDNSSFLISIETYLNNKILLGEEIEKKEIKRLVEKSKIDLVKLKLLKKLSKKKLAKKECEDYLLTNGVVSSEVKGIIDELEKNYLINDKELIENIIDYCLMNKKGIKIIKTKIQQRKLECDLTFINDYLDRDRYRQNIEYLINKYTKLGVNKSSIALKRYIHDKLLENGYNEEEFKDFVKVEKVDEEMIVNKEIAKFFINRPINKENITKITRKLLSKGFNYDIINKAIRECEVNETY